MALPNRDAYSALEDILGPDYISEEPATLDAYAFQFGAEAVTGTSFLPRAGAIALPSTVAEVQAIVKTCNKYKVQFKAFGTGWGQYSGLGMTDNSVQIDLRRMNRIIEINEKGMYAVVEPYVICSQLQSELMKRGFHNNIIGAGCNTSSMPIVGHQGLGQTGNSTSYGDRNTLAVEWVLPDGELLKMGSLGSGAGYFCGDGPGPSLRGILRGPQSLMGGLGIFTKAAMKIYHWPGPPRREVEGFSPYYRLKEFPKNFLLHYPVFPSWEKLVEAATKVAESEIAMLISRLALPMVSQGITGCNDEGAEVLVKLQEEAQGRVGFLVIITANSEMELDYRKKVLAQILSETGGEFLPYIERDEVQRDYLGSMLRVCIAVREVFRAAGRFAGYLSDSALLKPSVRAMLDTMELKKEYQQRGIIRADEGADCMWFVTIENGHQGHAEQLIMIHPSGDAYRQMGEFMQRSHAHVLAKHYTPPVCIWGDKGHDLYGPHCSNYHLWLRKIKKTFDPEGVSVGACYITAKDEQAKSSTPLDEKRGERCL
jgi:glycolate oxidase